MTMFIQRNIRIKLSAPQITDCLKTCLGKKENYFPAFANGQYLFNLTSGLQLLPILFWFFISIPYPQVVVNTNPFVFISSSIWWCISWFIRYFCAELYIICFFHDVQLKRMSIFHSLNMKIKTNKYPLSITLTINGSLTKH